MRDNDDNEALLPNPATPSPVEVCPEHGQVRPCSMSIHAPVPPAPEQKPCPHLHQTFPDTPVNRCLDCGVLMRTITAPAAPAPAAQPASPPERVNRIWVPDRAFVHATVPTYCKEDEGEWFVAESTICASRPAGEQLIEAFTKHLMARHETLAAELRETKELLRRATNETA